MIHSKEVFLAVPIFYKLEANFVILRWCEEIISLHFRYLSPTSRFPAVLLTASSLASNDIYHEFIYRRWYETVSKVFLKGLQPSAEEQCHFLSPPTCAESFPTLAKANSYSSATTWPLSPAVRGDNYCSEATWTGKPIVVPTPVWAR